MRKIISTFLFCFILTQSFGQTQKRFSTYLFTQYNKTLYDYTFGNNPWGIGFGLQSFLNNKTKFKPTIELTGSVYLEDDKVLVLNPDGSIPEKDNGVNGMANLFLGLSFHPTKRIYLSFSAGPSLVGRQILLGIKPSVGFYFSKTQKWTGKISYINVFDRTKIVNDDFGSLSLAVGFKL